MRGVKCNYVVEATHEYHYNKIRVRFEDGQVKLVDLASHLDGEIFEPLMGPEYFRRFTVNWDIDTITWPNDADFSPDFLYEIGIEDSEQSSAGRGVSAAREP